MYLSMKECIELTGLTRGTIKNLCENGHLKYMIKDNGYWEVDDESLSRLIEWQIEDEVIPNFPNYTISKTGIIKKVTGRKAPMYITPKEDKDGYLETALRDINGERKYMRVHRLVAITYIENTRNFEIVNHINGDRKDNRVENLEWCDVRYNVRHGYVCNNRKANINMNKQCELYFNNQFIKDFNSILELYDYLKIINPKVSKSSLYKYKKWNEYTIKIKCND